MRNIYKLLSCLCLSNGLLFASLAQAEDTLSLASKIRLKYSYTKDSKGVPQPRLNLSAKGVGDEKGASITFSGAFRFHAMYRVLNESYPNVKPKDLNISGYGDGALPFGGSPMLTLMSRIVPADGIEMGIGMGFNHIMSGSMDHDSTRSRLPFGQTFGAYATIQTSIGKIKVGGGNLYNGMSQLFSGWSIIRWNPFYRLPWDASTQWGGSWNSYENTYRNGSVTNFDAAYASGGRTQGAIFQIADMPGGLGINLSYGVDGQTQLYQPVAADTLNAIGGTKRTLGGRIYKKVNKHTFGVTGILNNGYVDNISNLRETQYMYSADAALVFKHMTVSGEFGATAFSNPFGRYNGDSAFYTWDTLQYKAGVDFLGQIRLKIDKEAFGIPLNVNFYHLGPNYINLNSGAFNTSTYNNAAAYIQINSAWDVGMRRGFIADVGQTANNRRAVEVSTQLEKGRFKLGIGTQVGTEVQKADPSTNQVMFYHQLNSWSRSGFNYWTPQGGPYQKLLSNYIQLLERVSITDTVVDYKKTFNVFNVDARYRTLLFGKSIILANYLSYQSAGDKFTPIPYFTDQAFVRVLYEELTAYYQLNKSLVMIGHLAYNKAVANERTTLSQDNGKPINQDTWGVGAGLDWNFAPMMGLYFREMWMTHRDRNFGLDRFEGFETTVELKIMF
jgi:hypothetical protein